MEKTILTQRQRDLLTLLFKQAIIAENFYLSGGTALAEYYLHHRYSEDLDFFSFQEVDPMSVQVVLKGIKKKVLIQSIDYQQSFNRNLFFLHFTDEIIKTEFTYYPFTQIEKPTIIDGVIVDSLIDIAANKLFTIYQNPRSRDFIDLYLLMKQQGWILSEVKKKARIKFDTHIDSLQLAKQLLQVTERKDYPRMLISLEQKDVEDFWFSEARDLQSEVLT